MEMEFNCPACQQQLATEIDAGTLDHGLGFSIDCPTCGYGFTVPTPRPGPRPARQVSIPAPAPAPSTPAAEEQKPCPMCGELILAVAKKCKHCGEYLGGPSAPRSYPSTPAAGILLQMQMKSETTALLLCLFLWPFGSLYVSPAAFGVSLGALLFGVALAAAAGAPALVLVFFLPAYVASIFMCLNAVRTYNAAVLEGRS